MAAPAPAAADENILDPAILDGWMTVVVDEIGQEHVVLSDGWRHIRLDVAAGSLAARVPVVLRYRIDGLDAAARKILPLQRFLHLCRHRRFARTLFTPDSSIPRSIALLRVHDAERAGASQLDIAQALFGAAAAQEWRRGNDSWRSRVRRLVREARAMAAGGYQLLMHRSKSRKQ